MAAPRTEFRYPASFRGQLVALGLITGAGALWLIWTAFETMTNPEVRAAVLLVAAGSVFISFRFLTSISRTRSVIRCSADGIELSDGKAVALTWNQISRISSASRGPLRLIQLSGDRSGRCIEFDLGIERASELARIVADRTIDHISLGDAPVRYRVRVRDLVLSTPIVLAAIFAATALVSWTVSFESLAKILAALSVAFSTTMLLAWTFGYRGIRIDESEVRVFRFGGSTAHAYCDIEGIELDVSPRSRILALRVRKRDGQLVELPVYDSDAIRAFNSLRTSWRQRLSHA